MENDMPDSHPTELFHFTSSALPTETFHVTHFSGTEGLNALFSFTIALVSTNASVDPAKVLDAPASFIIRRDNGEDAVFQGYPARMEQGGMFNGYAYYKVELRPAFWKLTQAVQSAIFLNKNIQEVANELLNSQQFFSISHEFRLTRSDYPSPEFAMQYGESVYDYILWRMEEQGAYFYFAPDGDKIIFADAPQSHDTAPITVHYSPASGLEGDKREEVLTTFILAQSPLPRRVVVRSFDWKNPNMAVTGEAEVSATGMGDVYLTNENVESNAEASRIAKIRSEELICRSRVFTGVGSVPVLRPGIVFTLQSHYNTVFNRDYMVTEITHEGAQETFLSMGLGIPLREAREHLFYRNSFACIESDVPYRPARTAPRATIPGVIRAFVDGGGSGARAEMDEYGRYKLVFPFDISGRKGGNASCWIRMAQPQVGKDSGMSFPLLPGAEVTVAFLGGNPDRPVITGALPNGETGALTGQGNANFSGIRTPGGNQITLNDTNNKQGISLLSASGLGMSSTDEAGSNTSSLTADDIISTSGSTSLEWANLCKTFYTGYKSMTAAAKNKPATVLWGTLIGGVLGSAAKGLDTLSATAAKKGDQALANGLSWGASGTKLAMQTATLLCDIVGAVQKGHADYSVGITAAPNAASTLVQVKPQTSHLVAQIVSWIVLRAASVAADEANVIRTKDEANVAYDAASDKNKKVKDALSDAQKEYDDAKAAYEKSDKGTEATKTYKEAEKKYEAIQEAYAGVKNQSETTVEEAWSYAKQEAVRSGIVNEVANLLPDITAFVAMLIGRARKDDLGGVSVNSVTSNINMRAGRTISAHSTHGIFLNATENADDSNWGIDATNLATQGYRINDEKTENTPFVAINTKHAYTYAENIDTKAQNTATHLATVHDIATPNKENGVQVQDGLAKLYAEKSGSVQLGFSNDESLPLLCLTKEAITLTAKDAMEGLFIKDKEISLKTAADCQIGMAKDSVNIKSPKKVSVSGSDIELAVTGSVKAGDFTFKGSKMSCANIMELGGEIKIVGSVEPGAQSISLQSALADINTAITDQNGTMTTLKTAAETAKTKAEAAAETACKAAAAAADTAVAVNEAIEKVK